MTDTSGAVIPAAKITVSNADKGFARNVVSNSAGEYTAAKIPIGNYAVTAEASGFRKLLRTGIKLDVGQTLRVDLELTVGQITQEITVTGNVVKVATESGAVSDVITGQQVRELNLNGRNWMSLTTLIPGAVPTNENNFNPTHIGFGGSQLIVSYNGSRVNDANVEIDGGNTQNEPGGGRNVVVFPNIDSIAEFRITTSDYGADLGQRPGAVIEVATKGGTKDFHGTAYEFLRNDALDANPFFINRQINPPGGNAPKQPLKWNIFGYNFGGPFYIPGRYNTDKSKTFFFWSQAWARYREGTVVSQNVPTLRMRQGDFSECDRASANYNPVVGSGCTLPTDPAIVGDIVPIDPNAQAILNGLIPFPNNGVMGYVSAPSLPNNYRQDNIRIDHNIGTKTTMFGRYTQEIHTYEYTFSTYDTWEYAPVFPSKEATFHLTHTFKPNLMNEFILGWDSVHLNYDTVPTPNSPAHSVLKPSTWTAGHIFPANATNPQATLLPITSVSGGLPFSFNQNTSLNNVFTHHHEGMLKDNIVYTRGRHGLKFGVYFVDYRGYDYTGSAPIGSLSFTGGGPFTTHNGLADMYLGRIASYSEGSPFEGGTAVGGWGVFRDRMRDIETYVQDDWKVSRKLTVNVGMRYQYRWNWHDGSNPTHDTGFYPNQYDPAKESQLDAAAHFIPGTGHYYITRGNGLVQCGTGGVPVGCLDPYHIGFMPRFGFAYDVFGDGKTALRGGYGMFMDSGYTHGPGGALAYGPPPYVISPSVFNVVGYTNIAGGVLGPTTFRAFPQSNSRPRYNQFNLTVEHEFRGNNVVSLAYVGNLGRHLDRNANINQVPLNAGTINVPSLHDTAGCDSSGNCNVQSILLHAQHPSVFFAPYRGYGTLQWTQSTANSEYNALQVNYRHRAGHGLTFQAAYTWSHLIDESSDGLSLYSVDDWNNLNRWRANSDFNRSQVLQLNYIYELPFFKNSSNRFVKNGLGGWQLSGISSFFTGLPINFNCTKTGYATGIGTQAKCNPVGEFGAAKGVVNDPRWGPTVTWFNPGAIAMANLSQYTSDGAPGTFGYLGRNALTGPGRNNWDMALMKNFLLPWFNGERSTLQFRWETFNTFNHTQWEYVQAGCNGNTPFGGACNDSNNLGNGEVTGSWSPRLMQFGLKFTF